MRGKGQIVGIVITLVCLVVAFNRINFGELAGALASANYLLVAPALLLWLVGYIARTLRWRAILAGARPGPLGALFGVLMVGFATNNVLPARLGEFARAYLLRQKTGLRKTFVLASIFLERVFDGLALVAVILVLSAVVKPPGWDQETDVAAMVSLLELLATVIFVGVTVMIAAVLIRRDLSTRLVGSVAGMLPGRVARFVNGAFGAFVNGLSSMRRPKVVLATAVLSLVVWAIEWTAYVMIASAFNLGLSGIQLAAACALLLVVVNLGIMVPAAPGYVGTFQVFAVAALAVWGVPREQALAVAIVAHLAQYVLVTAIGLAFFGREHLSLRAMAVASRARDDVDGDGDGEASDDRAAVGEARS
jgi:uncharacterized protein (TIRG00374 family)